MLLLAEDKKILLSQLLVLGLVAFMPLGVTVKSVFSIAAIVSILSTQTYTKNLYFAINTAWGYAAILFFLFVLLACLWSPAPLWMQWAALSKYLKLLYLPILALVFVNPKLRHWTIQTYIVSMVVCCIITIIRARGMVGINDPGALAYNHNIIGFMIAIACYFAGLSLMKAQGWMREYYFSIVLLCTYQIFFINMGRTDYLVYFALFALLLVQKLSVKHALLGMILVSAMLGLFFTQSSTMNVRVREVFSDIRNWKQNHRDTSMGYRIQFHKYSMHLLKEHPLKGQGTAGYRQRFTHDNPVPTWGIGTPDPHSQYWMILSDFGLIGFALFLTFLGSLFVTSFQLTETRPILLGILVGFSLICSTDTVLSFSPLGLLFIIFSALSLGELLERHCGSSVALS